MLGKMAMMYRKFLVPGLKRRYQWTPSYNAALNTTVEGFYITGAKFFHKLFKSLTGKMNFDNIDQNSAEGLNMLLFMNDSGFTEEAWNNLSNREKRAILLGYNRSKGVSAIKYVLSGMNDFQRSNLRKLVAEFTIFFSLVAANLILDYDDDDDDTVFIASLKYFLRRAQTELGALSVFSILLMPFALIDKDENKELNALGRQGMMK